MGKLQEKQADLTKLRGQWKTLWDSKPDRDFTDEESTNLKTWNDAMAPLVDEVKALVELEEQAAHNEREHERLTKGTGIVHPNGTEAGAKGEKRDEPPASLAERIAGSPAYKAWRDEGFKGQSQPFATLSPIEAKTLVTLTTINAQTQRQAMESQPREERTVRDLMTQGRTTANAIEYYELTTGIAEAAPVAEGDAKPEGAVAFTLRTDNARKIAVWIPVTEEALRDVDQLDATIRGELLYALNRQEETQLLNGSGTAPAIRGILNRTGIQTQAKGTDSVPVALFKGIHLVRNTGYAEPNGIVMHPNDFQDLVLLQDTTGRFLFLDSITQGFPERIFGMSVRITSTGIPENTALVGDFKRAIVLQRDPITVIASTEHSTYFTENKVAVLAEERLLLQVRRPSAFATITGI